MLDQIRRDIGTANFEAQYQQNPVPPGGGMIKTAWFGTYTQPPSPEPGDRIVISWDTAMKSHELADYSVALVFRVRKGVSYLLEVVRERLDYPDLRRRAIQLAQRYPGSTTLVEDQGSGTSLAQDLRREGIRTIPVKPMGDKVMRLNAQLPAIEGGLVHLPAGAPWREDFVTETAAFPNGKHDDQVDALSQALGWIAEQSRWRGPISVPNNLW
jgi:predicted phage terminase large subunit-like protein